MRVWHSPGNMRDMVAQEVMSNGLEGMAPVTYIQYLRLTIPFFVCSILPFGDGPRTSNTNRAACEWMTT